MKPENLQPVDKTKLKEGQEVYIMLPKKHHQSDEKFNHTYGKVEVLKNDFAYLRVDGISGTPAVIYSYLYIPKGQPVLIEMEKVMSFFSESNYPEDYYPAKTYFNKPENQYKPSVEQEMEERVEELKYFVNHCYKPFDLETARKMYAEGGVGGHVSLNFYSQKELTEKQLPQRWEDLESITGYFISGGEIEDADRNLKPVSDSFKDIFPTRQDAKSCLAMAQLLQLREAWIEMVQPGWTPDWNDDMFKWILVREGDMLFVKEVLSEYGIFSFPSRDLANKFLSTFPDLLKTAFCIPVAEKESTLQPPPLTPATAAK